ncbi:MAG: divalent-cation tolerance protein CutA [Planctomycetia bacterium]|nr:divalent-cation tolerance protein CutA [Planctomycetia bacterium]
MIFIEITFTIPQKEEGEKIIQELLEKHLIVCGQCHGPITSIFSWKGKIEKASEWKISLKTQKILQNEVLTSIKSAHPYEVPEIVLTEKLSLNDHYSEWMKKELFVQD